MDTTVSQEKEYISETWLVLGRIIFAIIFFLFMVYKFRPIHPTTIGLISQLILLLMFSEEIGCMASNYVFSLLLAGLAAISLCYSLPIGIFLVLLSFLPFTEEDKKDLINWSNILIPLTTFTVFKLI